MSLRPGPRTVDATGTPVIVARADDRDRWPAEASDAIREALRDGSFRAAIVKAITPKLLATEPDVPWKQIAAMRDRPAHRYFDTSHAILAATVASRRPARPAGSWQAAYLGGQLRVASTLTLMTYLVGAERVKLLRLKTLRPGTRVVDTEVVPSGSYHAVADMEATAGLCGATIVETFDQGFSESDGLKCDECTELVKKA